MKKLTKNLFSLAIILCGTTSLIAQCDNTFTHNFMTTGSAIPIGSVELESGIQMKTTDFNDGSGTFYGTAMAKTITPTDVFGVVTSLVLSNTTATYDVSAYSSCANVVTIEYFDGAGVENLEVNGAGLFIDEFELMPTNIAPGVTMTVTETSYSAGAYYIGTIKLEGLIHTVKIGGQQFEVDDIRAYNSNAVSAAAGCFGSCDVLFDFSALALGDTWGDVIPSATDHTAVRGDIITSADGVDLHIEELNTLGGFVGFNYLEADNSVALLTGSGTALRTNNVTARFDFSSISVDTLCFDFVDLGGNEQITINGSTHLTPAGYGELTATPINLGGVNVSITGTSIGSGFVGRVVIIGSVQELIIGGQEFWIDNLCVISNSISTTSGAALGAASAMYCDLECDLGVDNGSQSFGSQWGSVLPGPSSFPTAPGNLIFNEGGIDIYIDQLNGFLYPTTYSHIGIVHSPLASFGVDQVMNTNNATALFDLSGIVTDSICLEWLDLGGYEVLEINGVLVSSPNGYGQLLGLPTSIGGTSVQITGNPVITVVGGVPTVTGYQGKLVIVGKVDSLRIGGQEFWIDNLCISEAPPVAAACVADLDEDGVVGVSDLLIVLGVYGAPCP
jgi:hypothetical protein